MPDSSRSEGIRESALERLLATEARLDALVAEAAHRAEVAVGEANALARARLESLEEEIAAAVGEMSERLDEDRKQRLARLEAESRRTLAAIAALGDEEIEALARQVLERVMSSEGNGGEAAGGGGQ